MTIGSELKSAREPAGLSTEMDDGLNSFAAEGDLTGPLFAGHPTHDPLAREIPFIFHQPVPLAPMRAARGHARLVLTVLALGAAGWAGYEYQVRYPIDLDSMAAWASRVASSLDAPKTAPVPIEALKLDPAPTDSLLASNESAASLEPDRTADTGSKALDARAPQVTGTSGSLASPVQNVSGVWRLDTKTEMGDSSLERLKLHYDMKLTQDGARVAGVGTKVSENEAGIGRAAQTPVTMTGTIAGDRLTLNFVELGAQPETRGRIVLLVDKAGTLRGRFSSNAAPSSGHVEARRVSSAK